MLAKTDGSSTKARTLQRLPQSLRWDLQWIQNIKGAPHDLSPTDEGDDEGEPVVLRPRAQADRAEYVQARADDELGAARGFCFVRADLETHGYTKNCPKCYHVMHRHRLPRGVPHADPCRKHMERILRQHGDPHIER